MSDDAGIALDLEAAIIAVPEGDPRLLVRTGDGPAVRPTLPSGPLATASDRTLELGLRRWVADQTGLDLGYVEQLYTFGDLDRGHRTPGGDDRLLSIAYLALVREQPTLHGAEWRPLYSFFPWEDHRGGPPPVMALLREHLQRWAAGDADRAERVAVNLGTESETWDPVRVLERYELFYEAGLVAERHLDREEPVPGDLPRSKPMGIDHRRVAATALGRLRGKLTYRPVVFELLPERFTLSTLQAVVEALVGVDLHPNNFRRMVERGGLVEGTSETVATGGRPAELFRFRREVVRERPAPGMASGWRG